MIITTVDQLGWKAFRNMILEQCDNFKKRKEEWYRNGIIAAASNRYFMEADNELKNDNDIPGFLQYGSDW